MHYNTCKEPLIKNGYIPLPIMPNDKRPAPKNWTAESYTPPNGYGGFGVGVVCRNIRGVDIDILDKDVSNRMFDFTLRLCGETIYRIGKAPKIMMVYQGIGRKQVSQKYDCGRIEILGAGQQFVCFGTHPDTKQPYTWPGILGSVLDVPADELFVITEEQIQKIFEHFYETMGVLGFKPKEKKSNTAALPSDFDALDPLDQKPPIGLTKEECQAMLNSLNPDCNRDQWRNVGMALHHEFGDEGLDLWNTWSMPGAKYKEGECEKQWESFGKYNGRPITAAYLLKLTKKEEVTGDHDFFKNLDWNIGRFLDNPPDIPMIVYEFLPRGIVSLFYSAGGAGKSTLVLYLAVRIALANKYDITFLSHHIKGGKVVVLTAEDPDLILNRRFKGILDGVMEETDEKVETLRETLCDNLSIVSTFGHAVQLFHLKKDGTLSATAYYESFVNCLKEVQDLQLVIVDTKTRFSPGEGLGNVTATQEITYYEAITRETGASVMLLHHTNKMSRDGSQTGSQSYRDSTALFDSVRAAWYLRGLTTKELADNCIPEEDSNKYLLLENSKNNYIEVKPLTVLKREGYTYTLKTLALKVPAEERKERKKQMMCDKVLAIIQNEKGIGHSQAEIMAACRKEGVGRRVVADSLQDLEDDQMLKCVADGRSFRYTLTEAGRTQNLSIS
jgi:RecA-family ATPase